MQSMTSKTTLFNLCKTKAGLDNPENWFGDPRERLISFLSELLSDSSYFLKVNTTDTKHKILELWRVGHSHRLMGVELHPLVHEVGAFFDKEFYDSLTQYILLQENQRTKKNQPHIVITLEQLWLIVRVSTEILG